MQSLPSYYQVSFFLDQTLVLLQFDVIIVLLLLLYYLITMISILILVNIFHQWLYHVGQFDFCFWSLIGILVHKFLIISNLRRGNETGTYILLSNATNWILSKCSGTHMWDFDTCVEFVVKFSITNGTMIIRRRCEYYLVHMYIHVDIFSGDSNF